MNLKLKLTADGKGFVGEVRVGKKALDQLTGSTKRAGRAAQSAGKSFQQAHGRVAGYAASVLSVATAYRAVAGIIQKTITQEQALAQVEARLLSTGNAVGLTVSQLADMAAGLQDVTTFGQVSIAVLGQTLTTEAGDSGSYALGQVHNLVRRDIERADARQLAATLRRDLVVPMVALNHGARKAYPKLIIDREEATDLKLLSETLEKLVPMGLKVRTDDVRARLNLKAPGPEDEVLAAPAAPPMSPMPMPDNRPATTRLALARSDESDDVDRMAERARDLVGPGVDAWITELREALAQEQSLDAFAEHLDSLAGLSIDTITEDFARAFATTHLVGRYGVRQDADAETSTATAADADGARLQFDEQIKFFRNKLNLKTETWTDVWQAQHDVAFVVAGAARDELLTDLRGAVGSAIAEGTTLETFRKRFDDIVARHGWDYNGGRDWRTRVIYETNMRTSYAAGRWQQMQAVKSSRPYWRYRHSPASVEPRADHLSWDGLVLHADDPWWNTHYPPNGWGCKCAVDTLSERDLERLDKSGPDKAPALNMREVTVGRGANARTESVPEGISPGFAYAPGQQSALGNAVRHRLQQSLHQPAIVASNGGSEMLARSQNLTEIRKLWTRWRRHGGNPKEVFYLGVLPKQTTGALGERGITPERATITLSRRDLEHLGRSNKKALGTALSDTDLDRLPDILAKPRAVLYDTRAKGKKNPDVLLFVFDPVSDQRKGKVVVQVDYSERLKVGDVPRQAVSSNAVITAGYVEADNLRESRYEVLAGEIE